MHENIISEKMIGAAIEVHKILGPGFEVKAKTRLSEIEKPQLLTYLRLKELHLGLIINFHKPTLREGIHRVVNKPGDS